MDQFPAIDSGVCIPFTGWIPNDVKWNIWNIWNIWNMSICFRRHGENEVRQVHQYQGHSSWWNRAGSLSPSLVFQRDGCSTARWLWWTCTTTMRWTSVLWKRRTWVCLSIGCDADCWKSRVSPLLLFSEKQFSWNYEDVISLLCPWRLCKTHCSVKLKWEY